MFMFYVPTKLFQQKLTFYMVYIKMIKFGTKIGIFAMHVFSFLHRAQKYPFFMKLCVTK
jgi:hypothetical protein